ncbi:MAG: hypothetical protein ACRD5B_03740 [Nitrososphaeraceae archaeon]
MLILMMVGHRDMICNVAKKCDEYIPNNITVVPNYRVTDSLSDQVSRCNYCGREWNEFWISYAYVTRSLINQRRLIRRSSIYAAADGKDCLLPSTPINL